MAKGKKPIKEITFTGIMAALVFVFTFTLKIPLGTGYAHLGDTIIFISIAIIGYKNAAAAGALGAALADLAGGYVAYALPTLAIKFLMVIIAGLIIKKLPNKIWSFIIGVTIGGIFQIGAYTLTKVLLYGKTLAITTLPDLLIQTVFGIVSASVLLAVLEKSGAAKKLRSLSGTSTK